MGQSNDPTMSNKKHRSHQISGTHASANEVPLVWVAHTSAGAELGLATAHMTHEQQQQLP
eukprot:CAMPEP_0184396622 /NCGR_PEP_ID=MMETSP0007-20130409/53725_1 /TAXON_ID=97485 /ORGANISM="Prymnesium parvum, Strain Texoma1" /LENGTH=59 /DNA_ID=CAMNT_0026749557 /DNA_START=276 /DNA_END=452 /DNA_ORIENTATION=+